MDRITEFNLLDTRLEGTNLIEASAGTGKTYTIAGLLLRLVLEKDIPISDILVVTYTEAATSELKDRVRRRLREAFEAFSGTPTDDALLNRLLEKHTDWPAAADKLNYAVNDFDQASIFTIHGFCYRTLLDQAFASGILFDTELVTSQEPFIREIIQDFWRKHFYTTSRLFYNYALEKGLNLASLKETVRKGAGNPYIRIIPRRELPDCSAAEAEFRHKFELTSETWVRAKKEISEMLTTHPSLNRSRYREASIPTLVRSMDAYFAGECRSCAPCEGFEKFTPDTIQSATKKGHSPLSHPLFELCGELRQARERLRQVYDEKILGLKVELFDYMRAELEARKRRKNILFFDDLLVKLERALSGPHGSRLAEIVKGKYRAALIDEFQDTDSIQYAIFEKIFGDPGSILFLIGDPKQAIYGFRGADIFTYMDASRKTSSRFTLSGNWRSEPSLISAVNTLFDSDNPFVYEDIRFHPATPPEEKKQEPLTFGGEPAPPLQVWMLRSSEDSNGKSIGKEKANELAAGAVAGEISRLLAMGGNGMALIGERPLREGDIAVLVRTHREAAIVRGALSRLGIHSVLHDLGNLFETHEAGELARILASVSNPSDERLLRAALVTDIMGIRGEDLDRFSLDDSGWDRWLAAFREYHESWARRGFFRMFRTLLSKEGVLPRLMGMTDGERRCTNILHLSEVLHKVATTGGLNMSGLVKWLSIQLDPATPKTEEHQLRLESDSDAVKIVTIHKSKGLEYPIVFCPFAWAGSRIRDGGFTFHWESPEGMVLTLDLGSPEQQKHRILAEKEQLAENLRLLYVALTRAKHRCYLAWGRVNGAETSAPAYLFHFGGSENSGSLLDSMTTGFKDLNDDALLGDLRRVAGKSGGTIQISDLPERTEEAGTAPEKPSPELNCRVFEGSINRAWKVSSFSSLVSSQPARAELADRDETLQPGSAVDTDLREPVQPRASMDMFSFPRGPASGILLHEIFERIDFASGDQSLVSECVANSLKGHGFDSSWLEPVCGMVRKVLATPLEPDDETFTLSRIKASERLSELEFHFPLRRVKADRLRNVLTRFTRGTAGSPGESSLERLVFQPLEGFMKGFIDLVFRAKDRFFIVDWKSNYLGPAVESYNQEALRKAIFLNFYNFQYALYTVAVHQYLGTRIPGYSHESHFGGVYYLFVRGMDPAMGPRYGIYRDRPSRDYVEALCSVLSG
ncbi:MAG: exodeoxyribonuclease V subunit beta [Syntrophobacter sp.]